VDYHLLTGALGNQSWPATAVGPPNGKPLHSKSTRPNYGHFLEHAKLINRLYLAGARRGTTLVAWLAPPWKLAVYPLPLGRLEKACPAKSNFDANLCTTQRTETVTSRLPCRFAGLRPCQFVPSHTNLLSHSSGIHVNRPAVLG
jgi:hypothetical protein